MKMPFRSGAPPLISGGLLMAFSLGSYLMYSIKGKTIGPVIDKHFSDPTGDMEYT